MSLKITRWLFLTLILSLPIVRPFDISLFGLRAALTDFIFVAVVVFAIVAVIQRNLVLQLSKFHAFIGLYAVTLCLSLLGTENLKQSLIKLTAELYLFSLASVAYLLVRSDTSFTRRIAAAWTVGTCLTVLTTIAGVVLFYVGYKTQPDNYFLSHFGSLPAGNYPRLHALFANANMMANFLNISLVMIFILGDNGLISAGKSRVVRAGIWFAAVCTISAGLGGMMLSAGLRSYSSLMDRGRRKLAAATIVVISVICLLIVTATLVSSDTPNTEQSIRIPVIDRVVEPSVRVLVWEDALQTMADFPLLGKGIGSDPVRIEYKTLSGGAQLLRDAHNSFLNVGGQSGIVGLIAFIALCGYMTSICTFKLKKEDEESRSLFLLSCAFAGAFLFQSLSGSFEDARHIWILFGMIAALASAGTGTEEVSSQL